MASEYGRLIKLPMDFVRCLKYWCFASKRIVQWRTSGPVLRGNIYVSRNRLGDMKLKLTFQEIFVDGGGSASLEEPWQMGRDP